MFFYSLLCLRWLPYQNIRHIGCVFYQTEIHGTDLKKPIRTEYLIKQKPRGVLADKLVFTEGLYRRVGRCHLVFLKAILGNLNCKKPPYHSW